MIPSRASGARPRKILHRSCAAVIAVFVLFAAPGPAAAQSQEPAQAVHDEGSESGSLDHVFDLVRVARSAMGQMFETVTVAYQLAVGVGDGPIAFTPKGLKLLARTYGGIWSFWGMMATDQISVGDLFAEVKVLTDRVAYILDNELVPGEVADGTEVAETPTPSPTSSDEPRPDETGVPSPTGSPPADPTSEPEPVASP